MRFLGVLMLDTRFPRLPGDVGHAGSFGMPVRHRVIEGASPRRIVQQDDRALLEPFVAAGRALVDEGARALTTSCGFLARWQAELQAALPVPVWTSSLLLLAGLAPHRPGVLTVDAASLDAATLGAAGASPSTPVQGIDPASALAATLLQDRPELDAEAAARTMAMAARELMDRHPDRGAIVLECTNMPPYRDIVAQVTGLPVHDVMTMVHARWDALAP